LREFFEDGLAGLSASAYTGDFPSFFAEVFDKVNSHARL
jgi:hypothetical protein